MRPRARPPLLRSASRIAPALWVVLTLLASPAFADVTYEYDALGRLIRVVDENGQVTTYQYDAVGNLLAITATSPQPPPVITGIVPSSARAGETVEIAITGQNLLGATLSTTYAGLTITNVTAAATQITAIFALADTAAQGQAPIQATTGSGSASVPFTVLPPPQAPILSPTSIAVALGQAASMTVGIAQPDPYPTAIRLGTTDSAIATVSPTDVVLPAGQTSQSIAVTGGPVVAQTTLTARAGSKLASATIDVVGPRTMASAPVSVVLEDIQMTGPVTSQPISVVREDIQIYTPVWAPPVSVKIGP